MEPQGLPVRCFALPREFLDAYCAGTPGCLILDLRRPGIDGLDALEQLAAHGVGLPIDHRHWGGRRPQLRPRLQDGRRRFLAETLGPPRIVGLRCEGRRPACRFAGAALLPRRSRRRSRQLTPREKNIFEFLVTGKTLKQIAARFGVTVQSVWKHQQHIFHKFKVQNEVELVNLMRS